MAIVDNNKNDSNPNNTNSNNQIINIGVQITEGVALDFFTVLSILSRFIFPVWLLYIFIAFILTSGGLLSGNIWRSYKKNEEITDIVLLRESESEEEIDNELRRNQETNVQNRKNEKPKIELYVGNKNQGQASLNNKHSD